MAMMEYREGRYYIKGGVQSSRNSVLFVPLIVMAVVVGFVMFETSQGSAKGGVPGFPVNAQLVMLLPFFGITLFSIVISKVLAARRGRIVIDPMAGIVSFARAIPGRGLSTAQVQIESIREIILSGRSGAYEGRPGSKRYIIRLATSDGEEDLLVLPDEANARQLAQEISGVLSRSLKDLT